MSFSVSPFLTTTARGTFGTQWTGYVQGDAMDDPTVRNLLAGGVLALSETLPMWGGVGISERVPTLPNTPTGTLGGNIIRAPSLTGASALTGFSVFNQNHSAVNTPQSEVPLVAAGSTMNFYRLGTGARIPVAADPVLASLEGGIISAQVSWDFSAQKLIPYTAAYAANVITNAVWSADKITFTTTTAHGLSIGSVVNISGFTPSGYNGVYTTLSGTTGSTIVVAKVGDPGTDTVQGQLDAGGGALPVRVLNLMVGNSMTVEFGATTRFANWNRSGTAALILI